MDNTEIHTSNDIDSFVLTTRTMLKSVGIAASMYGLFFIFARINFNLFHSMAELFSIIIATSIFLFTWNTRKFYDNGFLLSIGLAYIFVGFLDLLHLTMIEGFDNTDNVQVAVNLNYALQYQDTARLVEALAFFMPFFWIKKIPRPSLILMGYSLVTIGVVVSIAFLKIYPLFYEYEFGPTSFKMYSEWAIVAFFIIILALIIHRRSSFSFGVFICIASAIVFALLSEIFYSFWMSTYDLYSITAHFMKLLSFYFIYRAIIVTGIEEPYNVVFHNLKRSEREKTRLVSELQGALEEVKTLAGFIPICINCKKIRDDEGYWQQVEEYIRDRSNAEFSHAICPECMNQLYPEYTDTTAKSEHNTHDHTGNA